MTPRTFAELMDRMLAVFPDSEILEDSDGQIVVYTGLKEADASGTLTPFKCVEEKA